MFKIVLLLALAIMAVVADSQPEAEPGYRGGLLRRGYYGGRGSYYPRRFRDCYRGHGRLHKRCYGKRKREAESSAEPEPEADADALYAYSAFPYAASYATNYATYGYSSSPHYGRYAAYPGFPSYASAIVG